jgi:hypothetical protein
MLKYNKIVTNGKSNKKITEGTESIGKFYRLVRDILWKWEMLRTGKNVCSRVTTS